MTFTMYLVAALFNFVLYASWNEANASEFDVKGWVLVLLGPIGSIFILVALFCIALDELFS